MANEKPTLLKVFTPTYLIDLFAAQRAIVLGKAYDGAGTASRIEATALGVLVTFTSGTSPRVMLCGAAGWGWCE